MASKMLATFVAFLSIIHSCAAQSDYGLFETPPASNTEEVMSANAVYPIGSTINIQWTTTISDPYVINYYLNNPGYGLTSLGAIYQANANEIGARSFNWTVTSLGKPYTAPYVFFFWVQLPDATDNSVGFTSHYFNLSAPVSSTTSSTSTSTTTSSTSSTVSTTTATPASITNAASSPTATSSPSSDNSLAIGLGVGLGVGIPLLVAIGLLVAVKKFGFAPWKKSSEGAAVEAEKSGPIEAQSDLPPPGYVHQGDYKPYKPEPAPSEMSAVPQSPAELGPRY